MAAINLNKYCLNCGCELERGENVECGECSKPLSKNFKKEQYEYPMVPFPKINFQFN